MAERALPREEPLIVYAIPSGQSQDYMLTGNIIQTGQVIVMCLGIHIHTHATIKEKEARDSKGGCMVGIEGRNDIL